MNLITQKLEKVSKLVFEKYAKELADLIGSKHGVYALYNEDELYYVGKAKDLRRRITQHMKDRHLAKWTHFSLYLTKKSSHIDEIESILIRIANPKGNKIKPKGKLDNAIKKALEKLIKERHAEELRNLFPGGKKSKKKTPMRGGQRPDLNAYFSKARPLSVTYKGKDYSATLLKNGKIKFKNKVYTSPTAAAKKIVTRRTVNGWTFWFVQNEDGDWVKLSTLK